MKKYLALFFSVAAIASTTAVAGQAEYEKCVKKCLKLVTDEQKELCPKACASYLEED